MPRDLKSDVRSFWESKPLFVGETTYDPGAREYFQHHENVYLSDVFPRGLIPPEFFPFQDREMIIDVGCGPGFWVRQLSRRGMNVIGIDITLAAAKLTTKSLAIFDLHAHAITADAETIPFRANSFDGAVSHGVIHHTPDTQACICEIFRILKPGGSAVISVYRRNAILKSKLLTRLAAFALGKMVFLPGRGREDLLKSGDANEIVRLYDGVDNPVGKSYTQAQICRMMVDAGFSIEKAWRYYFPLRSLGRMGALLKPLHSFISRRYGLMIAVHVVKPM